MVAVGPIVDLGTTCDNFLLTLAHPTTESPLMFRPGDAVPASSPYLVRHQEHREDHEVFVMEGAAFPKCRTCGEGAIFIALDASVFRARDPLMSDPDFAPAATAANGA